MTRRVRFTPWSCARTFVTACVAGAALAGAPRPARAVEIPFAPSVAVATMGGEPVTLASGDFDRDGDLDLVAGWVDGHRLAWLENANGNGSAWTVRTISTQHDAIRSVTASDVDGDGDLDVVAVSTFSDAVFWCENTAGNGSAWSVRTISTTVDQAWTAAAGDVDRDGDVDVLSGNAVLGTASIHYHENAAGNGSTWTLRTVFQGADFVTAVVAVDVDGDGDMDALRSSINDSTIAWHENTAGNGSAWAMRTVTTAFQTQALAADDVDGDGDLDVVAADSYFGKVVWFENAGDGVTWALRTISTLAGGAFGLQVADLDGDGDRDVVGTTATMDSVRWFENVAGDGTLWNTRTVGLTAAIPYAAVVADVDGDGDQDVASAARVGDEIAWYRNESIHQTACFAPVRTIFAMDNAFGASAADIDRDGDLDVFATSFTGGSAVTWHRNAGDGAAWTPFTVAANRPTFFANVGDVDGDGDADAFIGSDTSNPAGWVDNPGGGSAWPVHPIGTPGDFSTITLIGADLDGDGDKDALVPSVVSWRENADGQGLVWLPHTVATNPYGAGAQAVDLDRDGDLDIIVEQYPPLGAPAPPLTWYANAGDGQTWTPHTISANPAFDSLALDLDSDGDLDVFASQVFTPSTGVRWHENLTGNGTAWAEHTLSDDPDFTGFGSRDLDGDGDQDLVGSGGSSGPVWYERTGPGVSFTRRTIAPPASTPGEVSTADLDGDGAADVLWSSQTGDAVLWNRNGRGQVVLDLLDQVPPTVGNGDVFSVLRVTVTHGGRAGDSDLELARFGLLFEEQPGDPLTSAEANALVEELRIYRDEDGNGIFEPGVDVLVATVPTLALTAGIQTVALSDGDPNVQVAFGTPASFFVVTQLTSDASQQVPHQFGLTHLATGPSASLAEDRNADVPLAIACPVDFPSRLVIATPVELIDFTIE